MNRPSSSTRKNACSDARDICYVYRSSYKSETIANGRTASRVIKNAVRRCEACRTDGLCVSNVDASNLAYTLWKAKLSCRVDRVNKPCQMWF